MKKIAICIVFICIVSLSTFAQQINGEILSDTSNITVVKVWGSHQERGFAYGYLLGNGIKDLYTSYIVPQFGSFIPTAKQYISQGDHISIDTIFHQEAQAMIDGMDSAGVDLSGMDYLDILIANSFLDLYSLSIMKNIDSLGCSSLMSWGDATVGTNLNGKSVISRHLDWTPDNSIIANQVIVIHIPSEPNEQAWLLVGFAGQMSVLSGLNESGVSAFQHMMSDFTGSALMNQAYEPIWFSLRKGLEMRDLNNDGFENVGDIRQALEINSNGYAEGFIVASMSPSNASHDSLVAMVAELAPASPKLVFRSNSYSDSIPGDNLYAANSEIKRNDHLNYCSRYYSVINGIADGSDISAEQNWQIMSDYSNSGYGNIQFMQHIPEQQILHLAVHDGNSGAYLNSKKAYDLNELFSAPISIEENDLVVSDFKIFPNPANDNLNLFFNLKKKQTVNIYIYNSNGKLINENYEMKLEPGKYSYSISLEGLKNGVYFCSLNTIDSIIYRKVIICK
ncbi:MAG: T9SS type A sorting domain-containing protein [Bacteroidetes bacterium]|jgi:hypothetical protein|nr:T9SS type A sorting domain-containing protein [Bacteroidota bacterium]MBT6687543.1 T9SS type A sorting domain-containing protein [Bacteroidota bacterium]MBT7142774.1 T9SS type A sorting domain-containing protein [Bacteroidota bacterium]MBT7491977.1 T9SS type A sorting domain-containing protein [Bacteroidota bacterium]